MVSAIVFAFTSCTSSEDIEINDIQKKYQVAFKINPATVVEPFTWEIKPGELSKIETGSELRVRALIYDEKGVLLEEYTEHFSNYNVLMDFTVNLEKGNYKVVTISDVINKNNVVSEYWTLTDYDNLNKTKLISAGYIGNSGEILGITSKSITVVSENNEFEINIQPAGAVVYTIYSGLHYDESIKRYQLGITQVITEGQFNSNGDFLPVIENHNDSYDWRMNVRYPENIKQDVDYVINYILPQNNLRAKFFGYTNLENETGGKGYYWGNDLLVPSIEVGDQFLFACFIDDVVTGYYNITGLTYPNIKSSKTLDKNILLLNNF